MNEPEIITDRRSSDHDVLVEVRVKLDALIRKVDNLTDDHEDRIRTLEVWRWISIGMGGAAGAGLSEIINKLI